MSKTAKIETFMLTVGDFTGMFNLLDTWAKSVLAWEICNKRLDNYGANAHWVAWSTTKSLALALMRSGLKPDDVIGWLEAVAEERKEKRAVEEGKMEEGLKQAA